MATRSDCAPIIYLYSLLPYTTDAIYVLLHITGMVLEEIGRALWGERWQSEMARALGVHRDTVQDWAKRQYEFRPETVNEFRTLLQGRRDELERLEAYLSTEKEQKVSCPVCGARVSEHPSTFDGGLYECRQHGFFGVSRSAEACGYWKRDKSIRGAAFKLAKTRGESNPRARNDTRPVVMITSYDF